MKRIRRGLALLRCWWSGCMVHWFFASTLSPDVPFHHRPAGITGLQVGVCMMCGQWHAAPTTGPITTTPGTLTTRRAKRFRWLPPTNKRSD